MKNKNNIYLFLTILLVILSIIGGYFLLKIYQGKIPSTSYTSSTIPKIELIPTDSIQQPIDEDTIKTTPIATTTATPTSKLSPTIKISTSPQKLEGSILYENEEDGFSVSYSNQRQLVQDTEISGHRYTFVNKLGNFAIHVSSSDQWSWTHPDRQFTSTLLVSEKTTFRYDINTQTIIDLQSTDKNYTLQCIHNGLESLKTECDQFVSSFQLL